MSKLKKIIIILIIILIIAIIAIIVINKIGSDKYSEQMENEVAEEVVTEEEVLTPVENLEEFYTVKNCLSLYYSYYSIIYNAGEYFSTNDEDIISKAEEDNSQILYNLLDEEYKTEKLITVDNLKDNLVEIPQVTPYIDNMYVISKTSSIDVYVVQGMIRESVQVEGTEFQVIVKLDKANGTYSVMPQEYVAEKYNTIEEGQNLSIDVEDSITQNANNTYSEITVTEETYMKDLFAEIKNDLLYDVVSAYEHLDEEYKTAKFATLEEFNSYVEEKQSRFASMTLAQYQVIEEDGYIQYVLVDQDGRYYIANTTAVMKYTTLLDTYTVDIPQFLESYNSANDARKAGLNSQKIVDAINNEDYEYVYNKLDETFKANNFPTLESFEEYIKNNLYIPSTVEFSNYQNSGNLHMFDATFTDTTEENSSTITKTFIVELLEGTDFVMSFNV